MPVDVAILGEVNRHTERGKSTCTGNVGLDAESKEGPSSDFPLWTKRKPVNALENEKSAHDLRIVYKTKDTSDSKSG